MAAYKLPSRSRPEHQVTDTEYEGSSSQQLELDLPGICLLGGAISSFILLCHSVGEQSSPVTWILVATLLISSVSFVAHEMLWAKDPLIPFKVMATSDIGIPCITQTLIMFSMFGVSQARHPQCTTLTHGLVNSCYPTLLNFLFGLNISRLALSDFS